MLHFYSIGLITRKSNFLHFPDMRLCFLTLMYVLTCDLIPYTVNRTKHHVPLHRGQYFFNLNFLEPTLECRSEQIILLNTQSSKLNVSTVKLYAFLLDPYLELYIDSFHLQFMTTLVNLVNQSYRCFGVTNYKWSRGATEGQAQEEGEATANRWLPKPLRSIKQRKTFKSAEFNNGNFYWITLVIKWVSYRKQFKEVQKTVKSCCND